MAAMVVLVVLAVGVGGLSLLGRKADTTAETAERTYPTAWDPRIAPIADWVRGERHLAFEHPVEVVLQPEQEYLDDAAGDPAAGTDEEEVQEVEDFVATLRALGLVSGEVDLAGALSDLSSEGTLAYYDPTEEKVYVRGDELTPAVRVTLAHELTHVLQDQSFDLGRMSEPDFDEREGLRAMAEGDAERIEQAYVDEVLTTDERTAYEAERQASIDGSEAALEGVPPVLSLIFSSPYTLGSGFLRYREAADGGEPWDDVLQDPPTSEELLDPSVWETDRATVTDVTIEAPEGAEVIEEDTFDPLTWYVLLASRGDAPAALRAVDGWGGDAYVAYRQDGKVCAGLAVTGDDAAATSVLQTAIQAWAAADPTGAATVELVDGAVEVRACDPGAEAAATGIVTDDLLVLPLARAQIGAEMITSGATEEQARCASTAILDVLTIEQLSADTPDPATQQQIVAAVQSCA